MPTVGRVLQHCPALFAHPPAARALPLMAELTGREGLPAPLAAEVFVNCPALANTRNLMPSIVHLVVEQQGPAWAAGG